MARPCVSERWERMSLQACTLGVGLQVLPSGPWAPVQQAASSSPGLPVCEKTVHISGSQEPFGSCADGLHITGLSSQYLLGATSSAVRLGTKGFLELSVFL